MAEIAWQITVFLAPGPGPTGPRPRKIIFWDILFCPNGSKKNFGPNGWKAAKLLDRLFTTEWQSDRVTELQSYRVTEWQSDRVTEWQSDRVTESRHFHSLYGWVKFFYTHFQLSRCEICVANFRPPCDIYDQQSFISIMSIGGRWGHIQGSADWPTMDQFVNFSTFSHTISEWKGCLFHEKNCQLMYLGPYIAGRFGNIGGSANRSRIVQF